jgi:hypothetical protein
MEALKKERKEQDRALKASNRWVNVKKRVPAQDAQKVIAWHDGRMECCWFQNGKWFVYNGTYFLENKDVIEDVSHWCGIDWMTSRDYPMRGPGFKNAILYIWMRISNRASDMAYDLRPKSWSRGAAQLGRKPVFYRDSSGKVMSGMPENCPAPRGYEKIVCNNVHEAERYSELQRRQERVDHNRQQAERGAIENEFASEIRSEMRTKYANARNPINREFMRRALENNANRKDPTAFERESYLHAEAFEQGR